MNNIGYIFHPPKKRAGVCPPKKRPGQKIHPNAAPQLPSPRLPTPWVSQEPWVFSPLSRWQNRGHLHAAKGTFSDGKRYSDGVRTKHGSKKKRETKHVFFKYYIIIKHHKTIHILENLYNHLMQQKHVLLVCFSYDSTSHGRYQPSRNFLPGIGHGEVAKSTMRARLNVEVSAEETVLCSNKNIPFSNVRWLEIPPVFSYQ